MSGKFTFSFVHVEYEFSAWTNYNRDVKFKYCNMDFPNIGRCYEYLQVYLFGFFKHLDSGKYHVLMNSTRKLSILGLKVEDSKF